MGKTVSEIRLRKQKGHGQGREKGQGDLNSSGFFQACEISVWSGEVGPEEGGNKDLPLGR